MRDEIFGKIGLYLYRARSMMAALHKIKLKLYQCLEHPKTVWHIIFHLGIFCYVLLTLCLSAIMSLDEEHGRKLDRIVFSMESALALYFTLEYFLRLWAVGINHRYTGFIGRLRYATRWISLVDMIIVAASLLLLVYGSKGGHFLSGPAVQNLRFLQILRMLHVDRRATTWKIMQKVLRLHKTELISAFYLGMLGLLVTSTLVYITEGYYTDQGNQGAFNNYGDALWWGIVTLFTIGYGDIVPKYWVSKLITCCFAITCISLFTLTSSIIGVGLALMVQEKSRKKHIKRQTPLAAKVIQAFWREYLLRERFERIPFFKYTLTQRLIAHELTPYEGQEQSTHNNRRGTAAKLTPLTRLRQLKSTSTVQGTTKTGGNSLFGLIDSIKIRVGGKSGDTLGGLNLSLSKAQMSRMNADGNESVETEDDEISSTPATVHSQPAMRHVSRNMNNLLISHVFNPGLGAKSKQRSSSVEFDQVGASEQEIHPPEAKRSGGQILDKNFFVPPTPAEKSKEKKSEAKRVSEPEQRLRFKVSTVESPAGRANVHIEIEQVPYRNRDHSPPPSPPSPPGTHRTGSEDYAQSPPRMPPKYVIALTAIWRMKYLAAKKKFRLSRNPYDLQDITERVSESESQQLARLRKVQLRMERLLGPPRPSLLAPRDDRTMTLVQRLQLVEMRMQELDKKADLIVQMATQLADRVSYINKRRCLTSK